MFSLHHHTERLIETLTEKDTVNAIRQLREVLASFKEAATTVSLSQNDYAVALYTKMQESIVDIAKEMTNEQFDRALLYVERIFIKDIQLLQRVIEGETFDNIVIGFYHPEWNPLQTDSRDRIKALLVEVERQGARAIFFESNDVDLEKKEIQAKTVENGQIIDVTSRFPDVIYNKNNGSYRYQDRIQRSLRQTIPFMQHVITDKLHLPLELQGESELNGLFVPSVYVNDVEIALNFIEENTKGVLKATAEERGEGIYYIEKKEDKYKVLHMKEEKTWTTEQFIHFIQQEVLPSSYIFQKYIDSRNHQGEAVDFRIYVRKNKVGRWQTVKDYARISSKDSILTHTYYGGRRQSTKEYLKENYTNHWEEGYNALLHIALQISKDVDRLYDYALDELGIDLTIDKNNQIWMYEVNIGPWTGFFEELRAEKLIPYLQYLAKSGQMPHNRFQDPFGFDSASSSLPEVALPESIGFLVPDIQGTSRLAAYVAAQYDVPLFVFRSIDVDAERQVIRGHFLENDEWVAKQVHYPTFLVDQLRKRHDKIYTYIYSEFESIPKTYDFNHTALEQHLIYRHLFKEEALRHVLLPHREVTKVKDLLSFMDVFEQSIIVGTRSKKKMFLKREGRQYTLIEEGRALSYNQNEVRAKMRALLKEEALFIYASPRPIDQPTDRIRIHFVRRDEKWQRAFLYPIEFQSEWNVTADGVGGRFADIPAFVNNRFTLPTGTWNELLEISEPIVEKIGSLLNIPLHHIALDFIVEQGVQDDTIYFVESHIDEPIVSYAKEPLIRPIIQYAIETIAHSKMKKGDQK